MTPDQIAVIVAALLSGEPDQTVFETLHNGGADPRYAVTVEDCPRPLPAYEIEGQTVICGRISVPLNHDVDTGRTLSLAYSILRSSLKSPAPDPMVYLHGGPGGGALTGLNNPVLLLFQQHRSRRDIVTFDQRAAGISSDAVTCFDTLSSEIISLAKPGLLGSVGEDFMAACLGELEEAGIDLTHFNTTQNAKDISAMMAALGYGEYNIYGISYGTLLSLEIMRSAPEEVRPRFV